MQIIARTPDSSGAYSSPLSLSTSVLLDGYAFFPDEFKTDFIQYNGFVFLTIEGDTVTAMEPNIEAWEAWKASLPPPPEPQPDPIAELQEVVKILTGGADDELYDD